MADRNFVRDDGSLEGGVVKLYVECTLDANGDVTAVARQKGVASITHLAGVGIRGRYRLLLSDPYHALLNLSVQFERAASDVAVRAQVAGHDVTSQGKYITLQFYNLSSPANRANPTSCRMRIEIELKNVSYQIP